MKFADRMDMFQEGIFSKLAHLKEEKIKEGMHVIDLSVGAPNIPPAKHIVDALIKQAGNLESYLYPLNDKEDLKQAVKVWYKNRYGVDIDPESEVTSLLGSQEGLAHIALSIVNPGDTVLVPDPCYPVFADGPRLAGAKLYYMPQREENGYIIDLDEIPEDIRREAKFMVVSYPNNPTTAMAPDSFYKKLIAFAKKYDIIVLHDNAYSDLVFDGNTCGSFLCYEGAKDVGVEFNSLSKTYGLAGARVGFCIGNKEVVKNLSNLKSNMDYGMFLPVQKAAIAAITGDQSCVETVRKAYENRRNILCDGLNEIGWKMNRCPATMFVWAKIPSKYTSSEKFCIELLDKTGVLVTPGSAFGPSGEGHVRMALVQDEDEMKKAIESIKNSDILK
ncbi:MULTISPECIES: aminotransferase class I/II-fold pyridoxal phosphate-dependent enzyme [Anaerofustis]|uniref:aminotransferase class I/II-fold pyridoxal phosphate-dependent enzyme n=1 Tax=Anaerofustis TaxID=264995 RepID=UPI0011069760|nr:MULTISPECIES: aminotransferase class I/II-fold pyridoxal phosphate-dependent enzyme [Anaerofustis]MCO8194565.1 aminotransferase class I/II-fold pyridoxal phosphate-dependent enzyme [Anaerofustis sp. NSJ-163]